MVKVTLKGGVVKEYDSGITPLQIAKELGMGLYKAACAANIDGENCDLRTPIEKDCAVSILTFEDAYGAYTFRHTASHLGDPHGIMRAIKVRDHLCGSICATTLEHSEHAHDAVAVLSVHVADGCAFAGRAVRIRRHNQHKKRHEECGDERHQPSRYNPCVMYVSAHRRFLLSLWLVGRFLACGADTTGSMATRLQFNLTSSPFDSSLRSCVIDDVRAGRAAFLVLSGALNVSLCCRHAIHGCHIRSAGTR